MIWLWFGFRLLRQIDFQHALVISGRLLAAMRAVYGAYRDGEAAGAAARRSVERRYSRKGQLLLDTVAFGLLRSAR